MKTYFLAAFILIPSQIGTASEYYRPNEHLSVDGIPPISNQLVEETDRYIHFRPTVFVDWHPIEEKILTLMRPSDGNTPQLHLLSGPNQIPEQLTFLDNAVLQATFEPTRGDYLVFNSDQEGKEQFQNYRYDFQTKKITLLTDGKSRNTLGIWSNKGDLVAYASNRRNGKDNDFYVLNPLDPASGKKIAEFDQGEAWNILDWSLDDQFLLALEFLSVNKSSLWLINLSSGEKILITPQDSSSGESFAIRMAKFGKDSRSIYLISNRNAEFHQLAELNLNTKQYQILSGSIPWDVETFRLSSDRSKLIFATNENGSSVLHWKDLKSNEEKLLNTIPNSVLSSIKWHQNGKLIGLSLNSARSPSDVYSMNSQGENFTRWTETHGKVDPNTLVEPQIVKWNSFDGLSISGLLYSPPSKFFGKRPVMILVHGGPESQSRPEFLGRFNYLMNELGIALLLPNIRGSTGFGKKFVDADNGFLRENAYKDVGALLDWVKTQPDLDSSRILVMGGSYGGNVSLAVSALYSDKIACSIDIVGISNFVTFLERTEAYRRDLRRVEYGDERIPEMRAYLEKIAPLNQVEKITKPLFVIQGKNDPRVHYLESEQIVQAMKKHGRPVWYLSADNEGHGFAKKPNVDFQFYSIIEFVNQFLLNSASE